MLPVLVGLASALVYGSADFIGGTAARRISPVRVTAISALAGFALLLPLALLLGGRWSAEAVVWGSLSGLTGSMAILLLYAALAIGPMSILSPLTAVLSAVVPMTWGLLQGERLGPLGPLALVLALIAVVLVGFVPEKGAVRPRRRGVVYATGSGILIGCFFILIDRAPADSGLLPLLANRVVSGAVLTGVVGVLLVVAWRRRGVSPSAGWRTGIELSLLCGAVDAAANTLILLGLRLGELSVMSVLAALYPAGTILLAAVVLKERIAPVQWCGLALALVAAGMLAVA